MVDKTPIKKIKLSDYDLGTTLGTGKVAITKDPSEELESRKTKKAAFS